MERGLPLRFDELCLVGQLERLCFVKFSVFFVRMLKCVCGS